MLDFIYKKSPVFIQNIMISVFNYIAYKKRYGGQYYYKKKLYRNNEHLTLKELKIIQKRKFSNLVEYSFKNSNFYNKLYNGLEGINDLDNINQLPILDKELLRSEIQDVYTIKKNNSILAKTGGTTGKSLEVFFKKNDMQDRFALLDNFRAKSGYKLGKKTAVFSGKDILVNRDINNGVFWKTDYYYNVRYYSTFHVKPLYLVKYLENLLDYKPRYLVGFPSTMLEIANYGIRNNIEFPKNIILAIFPTAETITDKSRSTLELFFKAKVFDQYASSEGAPFIFECIKGNLHLELQSGVYEVLDAADNNCSQGRLVITSFTSYGTPLIRYDIGDRVELDNLSSCSCGNNNPIVKRILGRIDDFIYSKENGKINLGNISNTLKGVNGIKKIQVIQNYLDKLNIKLVVDSVFYSADDQATFIKNWRARVGEKMEINITILDDIPIEKSGKFRMVKNNIKDLIK